MTSINLITNINAPIETVFDISRNIDVHMETMKHTNERAISGRTSGCIELGETVTWSGKHFGIQLQHESLINALERPFYFVDVMKNGHFKWLKHEHIFKEQNNETIMVDKFRYDVPYGWIGKLINSLVLKNYLKKILKKRRAHIKQLSEKQANGISK